MKVQPENYATGYDFVVIGGGIVGLSIAREILLRRPDTSVAVFDKEQSIGAHASGRNSGVLHAGFYYAADSLKARLTRRGNLLLRQFIEEEGLPIRPCGKVVVASSPEQLGALDELARRARVNEVPVETIDAKQLAELEPLARTVDRALWSPTTAVASPVQVTTALAKSVELLGGQVFWGEQVLTAAQRGGALEVTTSQRVLTTDHVINAAGLYADRVADWFGMADDYRMMPFKGLYWYGSWPVGRLKRHVYPVPDPANPFLGVHLTVTVDGGVKVGPTAIPALWREDYGGREGFDRTEFIEILNGYPPFLNSPHHNAAKLISSEVPKYSRRYLVKQAAKLVPAVAQREFTQRGRVGVRAQMFHIPTRRLEMDFVVRGDSHSTHMLNAVSPAWTSALAMAEYVVADIELRTR